MGNRLSTAVDSGPAVMPMALSTKNWIKPGLLMHTAGPPREGGIRLPPIDPHQSGCSLMIRSGSTLAKLCG